MTRDREKQTDAGARAPSAEAPLTLDQCPSCDGSGEIVRGIWVYEPGCGFGHMSDDADPCETCGGCGSIVTEVEPDDVSGIETLTLRDTRPIAEQQADWDSLRAMIEAWRPRLAKAA
jgi:hypothetical protein